MALPDHDPVPTEGTKFIGVLGVPLAVTLQLRCPILGVALRDVALTTVVAVPETTVDEDHHPPLG